MLLHLARSLTDAPDSHLAEPAFQWKVLGDTKPAMDLHRSINHLETIL